MTFEFVFLYIVVPALIGALIGQVAFRMVNR